MRRLEVLAEVRGQANLTRTGEQKRQHSSSVGGESDGEDLLGEHRAWRRQRRRAAYALPLQPRDLRMVDPTFSNADDPSLLVREGCIIVNLMPVRAMLTCDRVLLFPKEGVDGEVSLILDKLRPDSDADNADMPFELRALEACFVTMLSDLQRLTDRLSRTVRRIARSLARNDTSLGVLQGLRGAFNDIAEVQQRCSAKRDTLVGVLDHPATLRGLSSLTLREQKREGGHTMPLGQQSHTLSAGANASDSKSGAGTVAPPDPHLALQPPAGRNGSMEPGSPPAINTASSSTSAAVPRETQPLVSPCGDTVHVVIPPPAIQVPPPGEAPTLAAQSSASPATRALTRPITGETLMALQLQAEGQEHRETRHPAPTGRVRRGSSAASAPAAPNSEAGTVPTSHGDACRIETAATLEHADTARLSAVRSLEGSGGLTKGISQLSETEQLDYHADVAELLVEAYVAEVEAVIRDLASLQSELESAERQQNLMLATTRNRLLVADIGISTTTLVLAVLAALYSMFGMNLTSGFEDADGVFWGVVYGSLGAGAVMWVGLILALKYCLLAPGDSSTTLQCHCGSGGHSAGGHSKR